MTDDHKLKYIQSLETMDNPALRVALDKYYEEEVDKLLADVDNEH